MTSEDRIALDGAFKRLARAQRAIDQLAEQGVEKTMTHGDRDPWGDFLDRLAAARAEAHVAFDAVEALCGSLISTSPAG